MQICSCKLVLMKQIYIQELVCMINGHWKKCKPKKGSMDRVLSKWTCSTSTVTTVQLPFSRNYVPRQVTRLNAQHFSTTELPLHCNYSIVYSVLLVIQSTSTTTSVPPKCKRDPFSFSLHSLRAVVASRCALLENELTAIEKMQMPCSDIIVEQRTAVHLEY